MTRRIPPRLEKRVTYTSLSGIFMGLFALFTLTRGRKGNLVEIKPFDLVQLGLASYRLGRLVSYDKVFEAYRAPFTRTVPDPSGEDMTVVPRGKGSRSAIGELIACPICAGTWVAAGLVYALNLFPNATRTFLAIMSSIGLAEFINAATEALQWSGQLAREKAGAERANHDDPHNHTAHDHFAGVQSYGGMERRGLRYDDRLERHMEQRTPPNSLSTNPRAGENRVPQDGAGPTRVYDESREKKT